MSFSSPWDELRWELEVDIYEHLKELHVLVRSFQLFGAW